MRFAIFRQTRMVMNVLYAPFKSPAHPRCESEGSTWPTGLKAVLFALGVLLVMLQPGCRTTELTAVDELHTLEPATQEFRGVWVATVGNLDWPRSNTQSVGEQQRDARNMLDSLKSIGINAVLLQVRSESDAMYPSPFDPWSYWLTGEQGKAPDPFYDPLAFWVDEAHRRGMELHAWINPYRVEREKGRYVLSGMSVARREPGWILEFETAPDRYYTMLNPGLPEVRGHVASVVGDLVRRYAIDGIHLDDYFYPYSPVQGEDSLAFAHYGQAFDSVEDWRRANVNQLMEQIYDTLQAQAPEVVFGVSPFAIRKNSDAGTNGFEGYYRLYADAVAWLQAGTVDYLTPQLYFVPGDERADYVSLLGYWSGQTADFGRHLYPGLATYRLYPPHSWTLEQAASILLYNARNPQVRGTIRFRAAHLISNPANYTDLLRDRLFREPALTPTMPWKDARAPARPELVLATQGGAREILLRWTSPAEADMELHRTSADQPASPAQPPSRSESRTASHAQSHIPSLSESQTPSGSEQSPQVARYAVYRAAFLHEELDANDPGTPTYGVLAALDASIRESVRACLIETSGLPWPAAEQGLPECLEPYVTQLLAASRRIAVTGAYHAFARAPGPGDACIVLLVTSVSRNSVESMPAGVLLTSPEAVSTLHPH